MKDADNGLHLLLGTDYDWEAHNRQVVLEGTAILERTGDSLVRANEIAIETENIGNEVLGELEEQREALLRTRDRLENANEQLNQTKSILRKMGRNVLYNKLILVSIIIIEILILICLSYLKFFRKKKNKYSIRCIEQAIRRNPQQGGQVV
ncbi:hypothetical protein NQ317_019290 [Molorchus minor]|uniref:t-SNARE coiled-coil homology domain-containing protein n=1 Tax=Molorchus minor TaxID=1323400 RepID=A0ABQ9J7D1_9CUCU|nr:hypothetical protein NQ317_019290 [Molorchus minor]